MAVAATIGVVEDVDAAAAMVLVNNAPDEFIVLADQVRTRSNMDGKMS